MSSKSSCRAEDVDKVIEKSSLIGGKRDMFLVLDVSEEKILRGLSV